ncbi:MAG: hypothetical protein LLG01_08095 [Planctomycetaceae bacterium]|nr:hypothetical protein [Planctomycetaceae bacterium]
MMEMSITERKALERIEKGSRRTVFYWAIDGFILFVLLSVCVGACGLMLAAIETYHFSSWKELVTLSMPTQLQQSESLSASTRHIGAMFVLFHGCVAFFSLLLSLQQLNNILILIRQVSAHKVAARLIAHLKELGEIPSGLPKTR